MCEACTGAAQRTLITLLLQEFCHCPSRLPACPSVRCMCGDCHCEAKARRAIQYWEDSLELKNELP